MVQLLQSSNPISFRYQKALGGINKCGDDKHSKNGTREVAVAAAGGGVDENITVEISLVARLGPPHYSYELWVQGITYFYCNTLSCFANWLSKKHRPAYLSKPNDRNFYKQRRTTSKMST